MDPLVLHHRGIPYALHGVDCMEGMEGLLEPGTVDVVVTSPPYNIGAGYRQYRDDLPREAYLEWMRRWATAVRRVLAGEGSLFLNVGGIPTDPWIPLEVARAVGESLVLQNVIHWVKSIAIDRTAVGRGSDCGADILVGHYKPINSSRYLNDCHEYVFHFSPGGVTPLDRLAVGVPYQDKSNVARWKAAARDRRCRGNTWFLPYDTIQRRQRDRPHPASFPVGLPERCLRLHGVERVRRVLDPFAGIGSTALACLRLGLPFVGFEIDPEYRRVAADRLREAMGPAGAVAPLG